MKSRVEMLSETETVTECHYDSDQWCQWFTEAFRTVTIFSILCLYNA